MGSTVTTLGIVLSETVPNRMVGIKSHSQAALTARESVERNNAKNSDMLPRNLSRTGTTSRGYPGMGSRTYRNFGLGKR